jgi:hypothetical protein
MSSTDDDEFIAWGGGNFDYIALGPCNFGFVTVAEGNDPRFNTGVSGGGHVFGVYGYAGPGTGDAFGPARNDYTNAAGVSGTSLQFTGVAGTTDGLYPGVYGQCGDASDLPLHLQAGVLGASQRFPGVLGRSFEGTGVTGQSTTDYGVWGTSIRSTGVVGQTGGGFGPRFTDPNNPGTGDIRTTPVGVLGTTRDTFGVAGTSFKASGVLGQSGAAPAFDPNVNYTAGVVGTSRDATGVVAVSQDRFGVIATSQKGAGIYAASQSAAGVSALSGTSFGVLAISGADGPSLPLPFTTSLAAVRGSSRDNSGVVGTSQKAFGVVGYSAQGTGVAGATGNPANFAGFFAGNVIVTGTLTAAVKNAIVPFPDGSRRLLHCMESPEHWFEDFGSARLRRGRATVQLDPDFAKVVRAGEYRVFLTPEGDCRGLYVRSKGGKSFEVRELQGGTASVAFSYRIVGKRKDIKNHKRFAKIDTDLPAAGRRRDRLSARSLSGLRALLRPLAKPARAKAKRPARGRRRRRRRTKTRA